MILNWRNHFVGVSSAIAIAGVSLIVTYHTGLAPGGNLTITQAPVEDLEQATSPNGKLTQIAAEDLEQLAQPHGVVTQVVVELLIPFSCNLAPPPPPPPPGCVAAIPNDPASNGPGCPENLANV